MSDERKYRVLFTSQGKVYEIYARNVGQGAIFGFIEVEGLLFGDRAQVVVDPAEESLKLEFKGVRRLHVPLHNVLRIDEVEREGVSRVTKSSDAPGKVALFPTPSVGQPGQDPGQS